MQVTVMVVTTGRVGLPDLYQDARHGLAMLIQHAPVNDDALPQWLADMLGSQVVVLLLQAIGTYGRTGNFRQRMGQVHQRLGRRTQVGDRKSTRLNSSH